MELRLRHSGKLGLASKAGPQFCGPSVLGGLAEFERELIRARSGEGRARAVAYGVRLGRKPTLTHHQKQEAISVISPQQEHTEPSEHRPCRRGVKSSLRRGLMRQQVCSVLFWHRGNSVRAIGVRRRDPLLRLLCVQQIYASCRRQHGRAR